MINPIAIAIPFFLVAIFTEMAWAAWKGERWYRINDLVADLSCGISSQLANLATKAVSAGAYIALWTHARLFEVEPSLLVWVLTFIGVDLSYYLWHRWTHTMNIGWASHVVHHQSEEYNLAVALRQSMTSSLTSWPFYLPFALLGVPPLVTLTCIALNTLYQFWIHTEAIGKLGPIEWIMNTPSHHRVHHAIQPAYLDKNHAGVFIVWDRMFGTFEPEGERPTYGTVKKLDAFDPMWANVWWLARMVETAKAAPTWWDAVAVLWRSPAYRPEAMPELPPRSEEKYDPQGPAGSELYAMIQLGPMAALLTWMVWVPRPAIELALPAVAILLGTITLPALFERRAWFLPVELLRLALLGVIALSWGDPVGSGATLVFAVLAGAWTVLRGRATEPSGASVV